jgi:hypothetical protein
MLSGLVPASVCVSSCIGPSSEEGSGSSIEVAVPESGSISESFSQGFLRRGVLSILLVPGSRIVSGISSMPGTGILRVMRSTICAKEVG